jgi:hypothetical protein
MVSMIKTPMADLQKTARLSLAKHGLEADGKGGVKVRLVLDHSYSMGPWYRSGAVQRLTEQVLGLAAALDDDGIIETWYFGSGVSQVYEVSLNPGAPVQTQTRSRWGRRTQVSHLDPHYVGWVDRSHSLEPWGTTNYAAALGAPVHFQDEEKDTDPALVVFQTDGGPDSRAAADATLRSLSGARTFFAFVVFGEGDDNDPNSAATYMKTLDTLSGRVRDNASVFFTGGLHEYASLPDTAVYDGVLGEFIGQWLPQVL